MVAYTKQAVLDLLQEVKDPEIPVISVIELGIVRDVIIEGRRIDVLITPTYSGCPAMDVIPVMIREALSDGGYEDVTVQNVLSPPWTTDWITEDGRRHLKEFGIAPPDVQRSHMPEHVSCPFCESTDTDLVSFFGSTPCKAAYRCNACLEPFDYFKCH
jgi:ring-1,2-phenylacetyl-CoA epoxidase subunit PaaD